MRRTAKGEMVDFDLIRAKSQIAAKPAPEAVSVRQSIIDRRLRKKATAMTPSPLNTNPKKVVVEKKEEKAPEVEDVAPVDVAEESTEADESSTPTPRRRQKTKPKQLPSGDDDANTTD